MSYHLCLHVNKYYCNVMECFKVPIYKNLLTMFLIYYHYRHRESTSRSRSRSPVRRSRSRSRSHERHRDRARRINLISKRVIISNVPYEMKWQDIKDIFRKEGITKWMKKICKTYLKMSVFNSRYFDKLCNLNFTQLYCWISWIDLRFCWPS